MFTKRNHGSTMRFFLWAAFYANLCLFLIGIVWKTDFLILVSLAGSLLIIITQKKHQAYISISRFLPGKVHSSSMFIRYLTNLFNDQKNVFTVERGRDLISTSVQFSPNPDFLKGEAVVHSMNQVKVEESKLRIKTGSSQCMKPYRGAILDIDVPDFSLLNQDMFTGLDLASYTGKFGVCISEPDLGKIKDGNVVLKFSIDKYSELNDAYKLEDFMKKISSQDSVKAIEIVFHKMFDSAYSLMEIMDKRNNNHFNSFSELNDFILKIRSLSKGKPIGIRVGIKDKNEFVQFIRTMREKDVIIDFITLIGDDSSSLSPGYSKDIYTPASIMPLDYAVSFALTTIKKFNLEKEIKIWAAGKVENGFDLLKLIALGADKCVSLRSSRFFNQISDNYFFDDSGIVVKSNILFIYRNILRETVQIMEYAGFSGSEKVDPKSFFRKVDASTIKNFDEIYFKSKNNNSNWGIFEDFIHLN